MSYQQDEYYEDDHDEYNDHYNGPHEVVDESDDPEDDNEHLTDYNDEYEDQGNFSDAEYEEDNCETIYRCGCRWKGGVPCREVFDDEDTMWDHLKYDHHTSKWIVQMYVRMT